MNLEDYAYLDDDRWYVDPNVSLGEQNAFINNLRDVQAQSNDRIEQQTRALGTQVPSQLGGLTGAGSYFRSRYQTPQLNQTVADLRAVMQNKALETALNNELYKAKKKYQDAQNAGTSSTSGYLDALDVTTEDSGAGPMQKVVLDRTETVDYDIDDNEKKLYSLVPQNTAALKRAKVFHDYRNWEGAFDWLVTEEGYGVDQASAAADAIFADDPTPIPNQINKWKIINRVTKK